MSLKRMGVGTILALALSIPSTGHATINPNATEGEIIHQLCKAGDGNRELCFSQMRGRYTSCLHLKPNQPGVVAQVQGEKSLIDQFAAGYPGATPEQIRNQWRHMPNYTGYIYSWPMPAKEFAQLKWESCLLR